MTNKRNRKGHKAHPNIVKTPDVQKINSPQSIDTSKPEGTSNSGSVEAQTTSIRHEAEPRDLVSDGTGNKKLHWMREGVDAKWIVALLALGISGVNLFFYLKFNSKSNAILDYVALASFSIKPHSNAYKTMTDEEYDKTHWSENPDDLFGTDSHEWIFYYEVLDSDQNLIVIPRSPYYDIEKIKKSIDTFSWKSHRIGINKVFEPKFQITNVGQTPAKAFEYKIGVKQASKPTNYWAPMTPKLPPMQFAAHQDLYPNLTLVIPYPERLTDTIFFRVRMHYTNILKDQTDTNYYIIWYPPRDGWYIDGDTHLRFANEPFQDEMPK